MIRDFLDLSLKGKKEAVIYFSDKYKGLSKEDLFVVDVSKNKEEIRKINSYNCYIAAKVSSLKDVFFCLDKKFDFIINPFEYNKLFFDNSTITMMKQAKIYPLIFMSDYLKLSKGQQIGFLKNAFLLIKLAKKQSLPVFISSGAKIEKEIIPNNQYLYPLFNFNLEQVDNFFEILSRK